MEEWLQDMLDNIRQRSDLLYGVVCTSDGNVVATSGDPSTLRWDGLLKNLFGTPEAIRQTYAFLTDKMLPQGAAQGEVYCLLTKLSDMYLVGLFGQGILEPRAHYQRYQTIDRMIQHAFAHDQPPSTA